MEPRAIRRGNLVLVTPGFESVLPDLPAAEIVEAGESEQIDPGDREQLRLRVLALRESALEEQDRIRTRLQKRGSWRPLRRKMVTIFDSMTHGGIPAKVEQVEREVSKHDTALALLSMNDSILAEQCLAASILASGYFLRMRGSDAYANYGNTEEIAQDHALWPAEVARRDLELLDRINPTLALTVTNEIYFVEPHSSGSALNPLTPSGLQN